MTTGASGCRLTLDMPDDDTNRGDRAWLTWRRNLEALIADIAEIRAERAALDKASEARVAEAEAGLVKARAAEAELERSIYASRGGRLQ